jgi:hypothetical protein
MRNEARRLGKKSSLIMTPSQAIMNLDNLVVLMVIELRPL